MNSSRSPRLSPGSTVALAVAIVVLAVASTWFVARRSSPGVGDLKAEASGTLLAPVQMYVVGGIAGEDDLVVVRPSGAYVVQIRGSAPVGGRLAPDEVNALAKAVARADLRVLAVNNSVNASCCDLQYRRIEYGPRSYESGGGLGGKAKPLGLLLQALLERGWAELRATP